MDIKAVDTASYHEYGYFPKASIKEGRIVVESKGQIQVLDSSAATAPVVIEKAGSGKISNVIKGDNANVSVASNLVDKIATTTSVTTWQALKDEVDSASGADVIYIGADLTGANQSINIARDVCIMGEGHSVTGSVTKKDAKVYMTTSYYGIFNVGSPDVSTTGLNILVDSLDVTNTAKSTCFNFLNTATNASLTITNALLKAAQYGICTEMLSSGHHLKMKSVNFDPSCYNALNWFSSNGSVVADTCNFVSTNTSSGATNSFCTICVNSAQVVDSAKTIWNYVENNTFTLTSCRIVANQLGACTQALIDIRSPYNNVLNLVNSDWTNNGNVGGSLFVATEKWEDTLGYYYDNKPNVLYYPAPGSKAVDKASIINVNGKSAMGSLNIVSQKFFRNGQTSWGMYCYIGGVVNWDPASALEATEGYVPNNIQYVNNNNGTWTITRVSN